MGYNRELVTYLALIALFSGLAGLTFLITEAFFFTTSKRMERFTEFLASIGVLATLLLLYFRYFARVFY